MKILPLSGLSSLEDMAGDICVDIVCLSAMGSHFGATKRTSVSLPVGDRDHVTPSVYVGFPMSQCYHVTLTPGGAPTVMD